MTESVTSGRTAFDHVAVAYAMVMSLTAVRLLDGARPALMPRIGSWVAATWMLHKLAGVAFSWWAFWWLRPHVDWTVASFLWVLLLPCMLCLQATTLVTAQPYRVEDWPSQFRDSRRWFFALELALVVHFLISSLVLRSVPLADPLHVVQGVALVLALAGLASARTRCHAVLAPLALGTQLAGLAWCFYRPP